MTWKSKRDCDTIIVIELSKLGGSTFEIIDLINILLKTQIKLGKKAIFCLDI